jgi:autotransporter-associated beta strand protein
VVQGNVALSGNSVVAVNGLNGVLNVGKYPLIKYSGTLNNESGVVPPGPVPNFTLAGTFPATSRATLVLTNGPGEVDLGVVSLNTTNLTWQGDGVSNLWDVVNSFNWTNSFGASLQFYQLDNVTFASTATNSVVSLQGTVVPGSITITGGTNYVFGGPGNIGGDGTITMSGTASLELTNGANSYAGGTIINSGVLRDGAESGGNENDQALGTGPVAVNAGAELRFGGNGGAVVNHFITNSITVNGGVVRTWDGVQHLTNSTVTIGAGGATFETVFSTKNLVLDSPLAGTGNLAVAAGITNATAGQVIFNNGSNTLTGSVAIMTNANLALVGLAGLSNCPAIDVQQGGIFDVSARSNAAWSVTSGQTLIGNGLVRGKFITASAGSIVAPGITGAIGTLTFTNQGNTTNFAVVTLAGTASMDINRAATPNADRIVNANGTNVMGGTLTVNNLGAPLVAGDSFQLLVGGANTGAFATLNLPALSSGLGWSNSLAANGKLTVVATVIIPTIPPGITNFSLVGGNAVISGTNGQSGGTYYLLSSTNLGIPRTLWRTVATNILGASNFTFIGTNAVIPGSAQQFYMLSSTNYNP